MTRSQSISSQPTMTVYGQTNPGRQRRNNEDNLAWKHARDALGLAYKVNETVSKLQVGYTATIDPKLIAQNGQLYIVADGVGGNDDGEKASAAVVETVTREFYNKRPDGFFSRKDCLEQAIQTATQRVFNLGMHSNSNLASTLVAALVWNEHNTRKVLFANVGDSRGYLFRHGGDDAHAQQTVDQVLAGNRLAQSMGDREVAPAFSEVMNLERDDIIVLCSDGLSDLLKPDEIGAIARQSAPQTATSDLIAKANARGGHDNITALVVRNGPAPVAWGIFAKLGGMVGGLILAFALLLGLTGLMGGKDDLKKFAELQPTIDVPTREMIALPGGGVATVTLPAFAQQTEQALFVEATRVAEANAISNATNTVVAAKNPNLPTAPPVSNTQPTVRAGQPTARPNVPAPVQPTSVAPPSNPTSVAPAPAPPAPAPVEPTAVPPAPAPVEPTAVPPPPPPTQDPDPDGDGVPNNGTDKCPSVAGVPENEGCPPPPDDDGDGVPNAQDNCPNVAGPASNGGCPPDDDGDGIPNNQDACPNQVGSSATGGCPDTDNDGFGEGYNDDCPGQQGTLRGCLDTDNDGFADTINDQCPNSPGTVNGCRDKDSDGIADKDDGCPDQAGPVTANGCPDQDGDGVADKYDKCPSKPGPKDNEGCPVGGNSNDPSKTLVQSLSISRFTNNSWNRIHNRRIVMVYPPSQHLSTSHFDAI